jgi:exodeoxyribonuclease VII small subunit
LLNCEFPAINRFNKSILHLRPAIGAAFIIRASSVAVAEFRSGTKVIAAFCIGGTKKTGQLHERVALKYTNGAYSLAKFEECLQRLEKIVLELERGEIPLEKSLTLFEEGMQLSSTCRKELEQAEGKVEVLLKKNGKLQAEPFEPSAEKASTRH